MDYFSCSESMEKRNKKRTIMSKLFSKKPHKEGLKVKKEESLKVSFDFLILVNRK